MTLTSRQHIAISAGCLAIGLGTGYLVAAKRLEKKYSLIAEEEIASAKQSYSLRAKEGRYSDPTTAFNYEESDDHRKEVESYREQVADLGYDADAAEAREQEAIRQANINAGDIPADEPSEPVSDEEQAEEPKPTTGAITVVEAIMEEAKTMNIFDRTPPSAEEIGDPLDKDKPYVITIEEFGEREGYERITITYYDGDDTLADDRNEIIPDIESVIGLESLKAFNGQTVIYVRNELVETDFEVCLDPGSWAEVALGIAPDERSS